MSISGNPLTIAYLPIWDSTFLKPIFQSKADKAEAIETPAYIYIYHICQTLFWLFSSTSTFVE